MEKSIKIALFSTLVIITIYLGLSNFIFAESPNNKCAFCNPEIIRTHTFYEDNLVRGLCSYKPIQPGHCMAVTKRHIENFDQATEEEISAIGKLLKKINIAIQKIYGPSSYMILQKNGGEVGQTVPHVHFHYIPKRKIDNKKISAFGLLWNFFINIFKKPISNDELSKNVDLMKNQFVK